MGRGGPVAEIRGPTTGGGGTLIGPDRVRLHKVGAVVGGERAGFEPADRGAVGARGRPGRDRAGRCAKPPLPCVSAAFVAKTLPLPCDFQGFEQELAQLEAAGLLPFQGQDQYGGEEEAQDDGARPPPPPTPDDDGGGDVAEGPVAADQSDVPPGWEAHASKTHGRTYYYNKVTGETKWRLEDCTPVSASNGFTPHAVNMGRSSRSVARITSGFGAHLAYSRGSQQIPGL